MAARYGASCGPVTGACGYASGSPAAARSWLRSRSDTARTSPRRSTICRLGRDRPVSRNEMCRGVEPTCPARVSWLIPRCRRHRRSRAPNGLAGPAAPPFMIDSIAAGAPGDDSLPGNRPEIRRPDPVVMPMLTRQITVEAPADAVWDLVGRRFDRIGDWATAIPASTAIASAPPGTAPTRSPALTVVDAPRTLTYQANGLPAFVATARNTWTVTPLDGAPGSPCTPSSTPAV